MDFQNQEIIGDYESESRFHQPQEDAEFNEQAGETEKQENASVSEFEAIEELQGKLQTSPDENFDKLMHSVLDNDKQIIEQGKVLESAMNNNVGAFSPDLIFEKLVKNYKIAKQIYGKSVIQWATGYPSEYVENNIKIPEFQNEIKKNIKNNIKRLKDNNVVADDYTITEKGIELASVVMYVEELDHIVAKGKWGEAVSREKSRYGNKSDIKKFKPGDRYKDISFRRTIASAVKRGHEQIMPEDLNSFQRESKGQKIIIYAIDASGSMKGEKIGSAKKAGIALAYKAISSKDKVGLIIFGDEIIDTIEPTTDFVGLLKRIAAIKTSMQTDISSTIIKAIEMFGAEIKNKDATKHLLLITDAMPTKASGKESPEEETLKSAGIAANSGVTVSVIGIGINSTGAELAKKLVDITHGRFYLAKDAEDVDKIVIEDYNNLI